MALEVPVIDNNLQEETISHFVRTNKCGMVSGMMRRDTARYGELPIPKLPNQL
jgi:hypothetical protein